MSIGIFQQLVSADAPMTVYFAGDPVFGANQIQDIMVKMKTHTPGLGQLLCTVRYDDGEGPQDLNVALSLTAGNYSIGSWPDLWCDTTRDRSLQFTYLGGAILGGTCDVEVQMRNT